MGDLLRKPDEPSSIPGIPGKVEEENLHSFIHSFIHIFDFLGTGFLCIVLGSLGTHFVDQDVLELPEI